MPRAETLRRHLATPALRRRWLLGLGTAALTAIPLVGTLGYEGSLLLTTPLSLLGVGVGVDAVRALQAELAAGPADSLAAPLRSEDFPLAPLFAAALRELGLLLGLSLVILVLAQLWQFNCDPWTGLEFFVLGPGVSGLLGAVAGLCGGLLAHKRRRQLFLALLPMLFCLVLGVWRIYADPVVYAFDPFFGYFAGPIYDEAVPISSRYLWFRSYNLFVAASALLALRLWLANNLKRRPLRHALRAPWTLAALLACLTASAALGLRPTQHGFHTTVDSLARSLPGTRITEHFVIHYAPGSGTGRDIELVATEHEFAWDRLERLLGASPAVPVHSFIFPTPDSKRALIGAGNTEVAPPWRGHVYINEQPFPHRVLPHELAHAFSYRFGDGTFGAPTRLGWGGLRVNLALLEGFATALAPRPEGGLDLHDQAAILDRLELRPVLSDIMGLGFWGKASRRAYTAAGSFSLWLIETRGVAAFTTLYTSAGDFEAAYGTSLEPLEQEWLSFLRARPLRSQDLEAQRQRFKQRAIFQRPCAHRAADLAAEANLAQVRGDDEHRLAALQQLCAVEPETPEHRLALAFAQAQAGQLLAAAATLTEVDAYPDLTDSVLAVLDERRGDLALARGELAAADLAYARALTRGLADAQQRQLQIKRLGADDPALAALLLAYFDPFDPNPEHPSQAVLRLHAALGIAALPGHRALGGYLAGRQLLNVSEGPGARAQLERSLSPGPGEPELPTVELRRGARLMLIEALLRIREYSRARSVLDELAADPALGQGHRLELSQWRERLAFYARVLPPP